MFRFALAALASVALFSAGANADCTAPIELTDSNGNDPINLGSTISSPALFSNETPVLIGELYTLWYKLDVIGACVLGIGAETCNGGKMRRVGSKYPLLGSSISRTLSFHPFSLTRR